MRYQLCVAVHLVLIKNGEALLLLRKNTGYEDGKYSVVAGHLEQGETVTQAMIRESYEEAGISIQEKDLKASCVMHRNSPNRESIDYFFECSEWNGDILNKEPHKCEELKFFTYDDLPSNIIPYIKLGISNTLNQNAFAEFGWQKGDSVAKER